MDFFFHPIDVCSVAKLGPVQLCLFGGVITMPRADVAVSRAPRSVSKCSTNYFPCEKPEKLVSIKWAFPEQLRLSVML